MWLKCHSIISIQAACCAAILALSALMGTAAESAPAPTPSLTAEDKAGIPSPFVSAQPVWLQGLEKEMNITAGYRVVFKRPSSRKATLRLTGHSLYRVYLNGEFIAHGPARGPHDYYRVDEISLDDKMLRGDNLLAIEVAGYNAASFYLVNRPSFIQAEVVDKKGKVLASTGGEGTPFESLRINSREQKVQRYSFQRPFTEVYNLDPLSDAWKREVNAKCKLTPSVPVSEKKYLPRRVPYSNFSEAAPVKIVAAGDLKTGHTPSSYWKDRSLTGIGPQLSGFPEKDLTVIPSLEIQTITNENSKDFDIVWDPQAHSLDMGALEYRTLDFGTNLTGFIGATIHASEPTRLFFTFDEILSNNDVDFKRLSCVNIVEYNLEPGTYQVESFEPYTLRYLKIMNLKGTCRITSPYLREYANDSIWAAQFRCSDERINQIFEAARQTFRQNAIDIFMDCPSRERAGWLCDSFFTARVEYDLTGKSLIEQSFLENYLLPDSFENIPSGMVAMCYPGDHYDGSFIPNWCMWLICELDEYVQRTGDREMADKMKDRVLGIINFLDGYRNEDGLLEKLPSWVFVEWSKANQLVQDVNYPSNMHFAAVLDIAARLYNMPELAAEAYLIRSIIRDQSFNGKFFVDNAVRKDGKLVPSGECTEVCQYFAFFFNVATPETHPELWQILVNDFGPKRRETKAWPEIYNANQFIGNFLRMELLSRYGESPDKILDESIGYLYYMAERTGTLWENDGAYASCNHGFASHQIRILYRDILGIASVDKIRRIIRLNNIGVASLDWCEGILPIDGGILKVRWEHDKNGKLKLDTDAPRGWVIINDTP